MELLEMAEYIGIDPKVDPEFLMIAAEVGPTQSHTHTRDGTLSSASTRCLSNPI